MEFGPISTYMTGILIPVSSLVSERSEGIGEFADLPLLAAWCEQCGLEIIQILPVNDSGGNSSPYSALSAYALHPVYLRLADLPEVANREIGASLLTEINEKTASLRAAAQEHRRVSYWDVDRAKRRMLRAVFDQREGAIRGDDALAAWIESSPWIREYSAYMVLRDRHDHAPWEQWPHKDQQARASIDSLWESGDPGVLYHAWVQRRAEEQFLEAASKVSERGIKLKGDIPILITHDSADLWARREIFEPELRAGAPPDMFSRLGQNWDLPIYDWAEQERRDYRWWKDRLSQASKFYHAYRIDHVLGFFRVWSIPAADATGTLGWFVPSRTLSMRELNEAGFDEGRVVWLARPHLSADLLERTLSVDIGQLVPRVLEQIPGEPLYRFSSRIGERELSSLDIDPADREWLVEQYRDRALIQTHDGRFAPAWSFTECSRYQKLSDHEKSSFEALVSRMSGESETMWEAHGRKLLRFMVAGTDMLACAEDLGVIPESVPRVLSELGILGLRIPRWSRRWNEPGQPFISPADYPFQSVCAPSVHDTSTIAGWWEEDDSREAFWAAMELDGAPPASYDQQTARSVTRALLGARSAIVVLQLPDILALSDGPWGKADLVNRVNVPGTVNDENWSYRMPLDLRSLCSQEQLNSVIRELVNKRSGRRPA